MASGAEFAGPLRTTALIRRMLVTLATVPEVQKVLPITGWAAVTSLCFLPYHGDRNDGCLHG